MNHDRTAALLHHLEAPSRRQSTTEKVPPADAGPGTGAAQAHPLARSLRMWNDLLCVDLARWADGSATAAAVEALKNTTQDRTLLLAALPKQVAAAGCDAEPLQLVPPLLAQILSASLETDDDGAPSHLLAYDARTRAMLRQMTFELTMHLAGANDELDAAATGKLAALFLSDAEQRAAQIVSQVSAASHTSSETAGRGRTPGEAAGDRARAVRRWAGIGLATVAGGVAVGVTGGLAAPFIGAGLGSLFASVGLASASAAAAGMGTLTGAAIVGSLFGVTGGGLAAFKMNKRLKDLDEFRFEAVAPEPAGALPLVHAIVVSGWIQTARDVAAPWHDLTALSPLMPINALAFDTKHLMALTTAAMDFATETAVVTTATQAAQFTVLGGLVSAVVWPVGLLQAAWIVDNPWSMALVKSEQAGRALARDILAAHVAGNRPVVLAGFGVGARAIVYCLLELLDLIKSGHRSAATGSADLHGIVESVYIAGTPVAMAPTAWMQARGVVAGRFVNIYSQHDWLLGFLNRVTVQPVAGLGPIACETVENIDVSDIVSSQSEYAREMGVILGRARFDQVAGAGWTASASGSLPRSRNGSLGRKAPQSADATEP
ncbi:Transmembrane and coiled-coil domain-containing protein 4 [Polyrhizophydium stewartii]|uniref:Transmembrane and coiled-coil domain-containing protein 4 n=1 Tax=Polyrhizophydium stewartii TaxID=2732419 RepID=A0ABR4NHG2_9FUNG